MITFTTGNLLEAKAEALVNTVNTVGVMGKGIALMFKEAFPENFRKYEQACKRGEIRIGKMFATEQWELVGPKWIINFPTKKHWRHPSRLEWIESGLEDLRSFVETHAVESVALPPLGSGNGGLDWQDVRDAITRVLEPLHAVDVIVFEPSEVYRNVRKTAGVERLTPARALIAELIRRYWVLGIPCTLLEAQKLAYFLERFIRAGELQDVLDLRYEAGKYGPFAARLTHLLDGLDGSYLQCDRRLADARPSDEIWFRDSRREDVRLFLASEAKEYLPALEKTADLIDGFQSPLGLELLATVDWLVARKGLRLDSASVAEGLKSWPGPPASRARKVRLFDDRLLDLAVARLRQRGTMPYRHQ